MTITPTQFIAKWKAAELKERSAAQEHFIDLCHLVGHKTPADYDPTGEHFAFERGAEKRGGGNGWADVWKRGFFGWEYNGKHHDLGKAYEQLQLYRESLENPPLLVVCDLDRFVIRTNFNNRPTREYKFDLESLAEVRHLETLKHVFFEPERLRPEETNDRITAKVAGTLGDLAESLRRRAHEPHKVARFLDRVIFCLFAEDVDLLPKDQFKQVVEESGRDPKRFAELTKLLFDTMASGGNFGVKKIRHFNGSLFAGEEVIELLPAEMDVLLEASKQNWADVDPTIFGTLFERGMDPAKRSQLGAEYTSKADIETLIEPVIMAPLRREWEEVHAKCEALMAGRKGKPATEATRKKAAKLAIDFHERLLQTRVLDPACGSGNFLYVALQKLKDLEKTVVLYMHDRLGEGLPATWIDPRNNLAGIEKSEYAFDLAQLTVWIGELQWTKKNVFGANRSPLLSSLPHFHNMDAILDLSDPAHPKEPEWPEAEFIVGNPRFWAAT